LSAEHRRQPHRMTEPPTQFLFAALGLALT